VIHNIDSTDTKQPNSNSADMFVDTFNLISNEVIIKVIKPIKYDTYAVLGKLLKWNNYLFTRPFSHIFHLSTTTSTCTRGLFMSAIFPMHRKKLKV